MIEILASFPLDTNVHNVKGDGSSKLVFEVPEVCLGAAQEASRTMREKALRLTIEVIKEAKHVQEDMS